MSLLLDKYRPKTLKEIKGIDREIKTLKDFVNNFKVGKGLLIFGPSGCGKTLSVYALARDLNYELFELNASNFRDKESIENILGSAVRQKSLFFNGKIILLDEIDGISSQDRGGVQSLIKIIEESNFPIILTSNTIELEKIEGLIKKVLLLEYKKLEDNQIFSILKEICNKENISYNQENLMTLAKISRGDTRAAITDLQTLTHNNKFTIEGLDYFDRLQSENINNVLNVIFKMNDMKKSREYIDMINLDLIDFSKRNLTNVIFNNDNVLYYWLEENIPFQYEEEPVKVSFEVLSRVDLFRSRIMRRQYWRYLAYIVDLFASLSLNESKSMISIYKKTKRSPKNNRKLWFLVSRKKKDIATKISLFSKTSLRKTLNEFFYYIKIIKDNTDLQDYLDLTPEEIEWLKK
ncbi:AAA family ATPase [Candidatus Woesearchaeota archaeon]|nr:AAA family ATPase [Candidatus Woesearchaeota archaeon]